MTQMVAMVIAGLLAFAGFGSAATVALPSPGCDDNSEETGCCPAEDLDPLATGMNDVWACLDSVLA